MRPLREGLYTPGGGEVVVRAGNTVGRVYTWGGGIAWVTCSTIRARLSDMLEEVADIEHDVIEAVIEECDRTKHNFGETLLAWGVIDRETLRRCLLLHNATHLMGLVSMGEAAVSMFIPKARHYSGTLLFTLAELLEKANELEARHESVPPLPSPASELLSQAYTAIPDCTALIVVDLRVPSVRATWPPAKLTSTEEVQIAEVCSRMLETSALAPFDPDGTVHGAMALGKGSVFQLCRGPGGLVAVALCFNVRNQGLTIGMAKARLRVLIEDGW